MYSLPHVVVASTIANGIDFKGLTEQGELSLQGWRFLLLVSVGLTGSTFISKPRCPITGQPTGKILIMSPDLSPAQLPSKEQALTVSRVMWDKGTRFPYQESTKKYQFKERKGKGKLRPQGTKMKLTVDCKEWGMGEFPCWGRNTSWKKIQN